MVKQDGRRNTELPNFKALKLYGILASFLLLATPTAADQNVKANTLFVEATRLFAEVNLDIGKATSALLEEYEKLTEVNSLLSSIVADYPGSNLAVRIITGETLGAINPIELQSTIAATEKRIRLYTCYDSPSFDCLAESSFEYALSSKNENMLNLVFRVVAAYANAGEIKHAIQILEIIKNSPEADVWVDAARLEIARAIYLHRQTISSEDMGEYLSNIEKPERNHNLIPYLVYVGDLNKANSMMSEELNGFLAIASVSNFIKALIETGNEKAALDFINGLDDVQVKVQALTEAVVYLENDEAQEELKTLLPEVPAHMKVLAYARLDDLPSAIAIIEDQNNPILWQLASTEIAQTRNYDLAFEIAFQSESEMGKWGLIANIIGEIAKAESLSSAIEIARQFETPEGISVVTSSLARHLAQGMIDAK